MIKRNKRPNRKRPGPPRRGPLRDRGYLDYLRECECSVPHLRFESTALEFFMGFAGPDPAHGPVNGMRSKGPDNEAIPLCRLHHMEQTAIGWPAFEEKYKFSRAETAAKLYEIYLKGKAK